MASLGDITFTLRGDTASFSTAMKGAASALDELQRDVKLIQADFRSGKIGIEEYRRAMAATHQQARDLGGGIHTLADKDLTRLNTVLRQTIPAAEKAGITLRTLRSPLASLAANTVGVSGPLGSLSSMLISLGVGGPAGIAAIAGIGAIGFAINRLKGHTEEAHKTYTDWLDSLRKDTPLAMLGGEMDALVLKVARLSEKFTKANDGRPGGPMSLRARTINKELQEAVAELGTIQQQYNAVFEGLTDHSDKATKQTKEWSAATMDANNALRSLTATFEKWKDNTIDRPTLFTSSFVLGKKKSESGAGKMRDDIVSGVQETARGLSGKDLLPPELQDKVSEEAKRLGTALSRSIASGLLSGNSIGSTLKNIFKQVLEEILAQIIKGFAIKFAAALFPGGGAAGGILKGLGGLFGLSRAADGVVPTGPFEIAITVPSSRSPMDQARDAWWLSTMSETLRSLQATNSIRVSYV